MPNVVDVQSMSVNGQTVRMRTNIEIRPGYSPYIGTNGNWWIYDTSVKGFVDSGKPSRGQQGEQGATGPQGEKGDSYVMTDADYAIIESEVLSDVGNDIYSAFATKEISGSIVSFSDGADNVPVKSAVVQIEFVQSGTGDPSPENIRPISGWTGATICDGSTNLYSVNDGYIGAYFSSNKIAASSSAYCVVIPCKPNTTYVAHKLRGTRFQVAYTTGEPVVDESIYGLVSNNNSSTIIITTGDNAQYLVLYVFYKILDPALGITLEQMLESVYVGEGVYYSVSWEDEAGTVYGGTLNPLTGHGWITHYAVTYNGSEDGWTLTPSFNQLSRNLPYPAYFVNGATLAWTCDRLLPVTNNQRASNIGNYASVIGSGSGIALSVPDATTTAEIKAWLADNPVTFCYQLATPIEIQLTPVQIKTLYGLNNIWADTGSSEITYRADPVMYTEEVVEETYESLLPAFPTAEVSGAVASFPDGADNIPLKSCVVNIEPIQAGSGDPSPDNVRQISGWDTVTIPRTGKNMLPQHLYANGATVNGITFAPQSDGTIHVSGTATADAIFAFIYNADWVYQQGQYYMSGCPEGGGNTTYFWTMAFQGGLLGAAEYGSGRAWPTTPVDPNSDARYKKIRPTITVRSGVTLDVVFKPMLTSEPSSYSEYEPYNGNTYPIALGQTVYGGTVDLGSGVMTVTHYAVTYNGSETGWTWTASYRQLSKTLPYPVYYEGIDTLVWICDRLRPTRNRYRQANMGNYASVVNSGAAVALSVPDATTVEEAKAWLAANNVTFCYQLATPQTIQLTLTQINSLLGQNHIWADCGDISVTYRADPTLYVDGQIAPIKAIIATEETETTASNAYSTGQYFIHDNQLCKALTSIAIGATFTLNTNYAVTTIAAELFSALNS